MLRIYHKTSYKCSKFANANIVSERISGGATTPSVTARVAGRKRSQWVQILFTRSRQLSIKLNPIESGARTLCFGRPALGDPSINPILASSWRGPCAPLRNDVRAELPRFAFQPSKILSLVHLVRVLTRRLTNRIIGGEQHDGCGSTANH